MIKKITFLLSVFALVLPTLLSAQEALSTDAKIDSIYVLQKKMYGESKTTRLDGKKYGVELNLLRFIFIDDAFTMSGGFSMFDVNRNAEISFPVYYQNPKSDDDLTEFTLDCHYRYFLNDNQNGFYISGFTRYAYLNGTLNNGYWIDSSTDSYEKGTENKLGLGVGIGVRIFSRKGFYWGTSLSVGRYIIGESDKFRGDFLGIDDDNEIILDFEILKFGWAF